MLKEEDYELWVNLLEAVSLRWGASAAADVDQRSKHHCDCLEVYNLAVPGKLFQASETRAVHEQMVLAHKIEVVRGWRDDSDQWTGKAVLSAKRGPA